MKRYLLLALSFMKGNIWYARKLGVTIGDGCRVYIKSWGSEPFLVRLGDRVTVTSGVRLLTHDGATWLVRSEGERFQRFGSVVVGDDVFIGVNSIVMPGVSIGSRVIVAAGSVVTKDVPAGSVVAGCPAKVISTFEAYQDKVRSHCARSDELIGTYEERVAQALKIQAEKS